MDITKLLQSLEEFVFEVAALVVLIPKAFFKLALFPNRICKYVDEQLLLPVEARFDNYASPLIMWLVTGLIPHFIVLTVLASLPSLHALLPSDVMSIHLLQLSAEARFTALSVLAVSLPVALAVITVRERKQRISKTSLRGPLYCFCYGMCPPLLAAVPAWLLWAAENRETSSQVIQYVEIYADCIAIWFVYITLRLFRCQLNITWGRSFVLICKAYAAFIGFMIVLEMSVLLTVEIMHMNMSDPVPTSATPVALHDLGVV